MSIRFCQRQCILSFTKKVSGKVSIFTMVLWARPNLIRSRETAMTFIPGLRVSPQAATEGPRLSVCQKTELYAEAVTSRPIHWWVGGCGLGGSPQENISMQGSKIFFKIGRASCRERR